MQLDVPFDLSFDSTAAVDGQRLEISFVSMGEDLRCPLPVLCLQIGHIVVELNVETEAEGETIFHLSTATSNTSYFIGFPSTIDTMGYRISLLGVEPPAAISSDTIPEEDYVLKIEVMEPWRTGAINLFDADSYSSYSTRQMGALRSATMSVNDDSLVVPVQYAGGCGEHDFYLVGACPSDTASPAPLSVYIIHDGHGDTCEALISETLKFDLSPLRNCGLTGSSIAIKYLGHTTTVNFDL